MSTHSDAFYFHQTTKQKVESPFSDVVKGMWFCLTNHVFNAPIDSIVTKFPLDHATGQIKPATKLCMDVMMKGEKQVGEKF